MTITEEDRAEYESVVSDFIPQHRPDMCFTACLKNILDEITNRHGVSGFSLSIGDLNRIFDYRDRGASSTRNIPAKLNPEIEDFGYNAKVAIGIELGDLVSIIRDHNRSYPIVDLDEAYFDSVDGYDPRAGADGYQWPHTVIPFAVNHETVLFYDPFGPMMMRSTNVDYPPSERTRTEFYEWWSAPESRWVMWVQREGQRTLTSPEFQGGGNGGD